MSQELYRLTGILQATYLAQLAAYRRAQAASSERILDRISAQMDATSELCGPLEEFTDAVNEYTCAQEHVQLLATARSMSGANTAAREDHASQRRSAIIATKAIIAQAADAVTAAQQENQLGFENLARVAALLPPLRRAPVADVASIYRIVPLPQRDVFTICGIPLPSGAGIKAALVSSPERTGAALTYAAQLTRLLARYLCVQLRFPVVANGGIISMSDPCAPSATSYPLFGVKDRNSHMLGVVLLCRDIQQLMVAVGCDKSNLIAPLPNLYQLLTNFLLKN